MLASLRHLVFTQTVSLVDYIVPNAKKQDLMLLYNLPAFADNDVGAFLNGVARSNNLLKKVCVILSVLQVLLT